MKKITFILIVMFAFIGGSYAQTIPTGFCGIQFTYDAAGNRTQMAYICNNGARVAQRDSLHTNETAETMEVDALYPNPTSGKFYLTFTKDITNERIAILDGNGKLVRQVYGSGNRIEFDLSGLPNGLYYVSIQQPNGQPITKKVLKF